ncbi:hypothetical protein P2C05_19610, partial [Xanthomonas perforans]
MKIKRFVAPDMRTAFRMVREEHGPDAVILSNRRTAEGIEIVAASNYDEELVQRALETARSDTPAPAQHQQAPAQPAPAPQAPAKPSAPVHALLKPSADTEASQRQRVASAADDMIAAMALRQPVSVPRQAPVAAPVRTASIPSPAAQALAHAVAVTAAPRQEHALSAVPEQLFADFLTTAPGHRRGRDGRALHRCSGQKVGEQLFRYGRQRVFLARRGGDGQRGGEGLGCGRRERG